MGENERDAMLARITAANTKRNADARRGNPSHDFVASSKSVVDNATDDGSDDDDDDDNDRVAMKQARKKAKKEKKEKKKAKKNKKSKKN